jgi:CubicO group peptidase (beta-lactamase class C family)
MKKLITSLTALFLFLTLYSQSDPRLRGLDTFVTKVLKDWNAPGVAIAVVEKNKVIYVGGFGYRDVEKKLPVTENTLYAIGSCTKAMTCAILGTLASEGKLDLDKPVRNYLPELKFKNEYTNNHVTLRDMMCHRTGLPRHDMSWYASWASRNEFLKRIEHLEPTYELREKWQYNNFMFLAQGVVIEKITGKSWEQNMKERILNPIGMSTTNFSTKDMEKSDDKSLAYATNAQGVIKHIPYRNIDAMGPAGSVNSSAKDMAKWLITWINGGKYEGKDIFPASYRNDAMTIQMAIGGGQPSPEFPDLHISGYGLGWGISSYRGHYRVEHGGGIDGFISSTGFFPTDSIGIYVVSNQGQPVAVIRNFIADRMLKLAYRNWNKSQMDATERAKKAAAATKKNDSLGRKFNTKPSHEFADYAGVYANPGYGTIEIMAGKDGLTSKFNSIDIRFEHLHYDQFNAFPSDPSFDGDDPLKVTFHIDGTGNINRLTIPFEGGVDDIEFKREAKAIDVKKSDLAKYTGEFEISGMAITIELKDDHLVLNAPGQPQYDLIPVKTDEFALKNMDGYTVRFELDDKKQVTALYSIQPNGTFKAPKKK